MDFNENATYYDILNLTPDASPNEIREAYLRIKATFQKDSVALYSIMDPSEGEEMLRKIEKAYEVLSNPQKRRDYDRYFGQLASNVIPIDRNPPMEQVENGDSFLVAPATDFQTKAHPASTPKAASGAAALDPFTAPATQLPRTPVPPPAPVAPMSPPPSPVQGAVPPPLVPGSGIDEEIRSETEWSGAFLRKVREARRLTLDDVTNSTRITKSYLVAIEEENFAKLPAPVYIRGFVTQIARMLKIPVQPSVNGYLARYQKARPEKFS